MLHSASGGAPGIGLHFRGPGIVRLPGRDLEMAQYIVTGSYTSAAMKGMIAHPSDREKATAALIAAAGGKLESYFLTTGETDFIMRVTSSDMTKMLAALMVAGASGAVTGLKTVQCFTSAEFLEAQNAAGAIAMKYAAPS